MLQARTKRRERDGGLVTLTVIVSALMAVGTFAQYVFGTLGPFLVADFGLRRAQLGALTTVLFASATALSPFIGYSIDRVQARTAYSVLFAVSAAALAGMALSPAYLVFSAFAAVAGVSHAMANPLSNRVIADHVPVHRQGVVMGVKQSGVQIGAVVAGLSLPWLAAAVGWRAALAGVAALVVLAWLASVARIPRHPPAPAEAATTGGSIDRAVLILAGYAFLMGSVMSSVLTYLPLYAHEVIGLRPPVAGTLVGAIGAVGMASRILMGYATDRVGDVTLLLNTLAAVATVAVAAILLAQPLGPGLLWLGALLFGCSVAWNAVAMIAVVKVAGRNATGRASSYVMVGFFGGFIAAPVLFGLAVDVTGYALPWTTLVLLLVATSLGMWVWRRRTGRTRRTTRSASSA